MVTKFNIFENTNSGEKISDNYGWDDKISPDDLLQVAKDIYWELNAKLYQNWMPYITFNLIKSKRVGARVVSKRRPDYKMGDKCLYWPTTMEISGYWNWTKRQLMAVIGHEIVHVKMQVDGNHKENHGLLFKRELNRINNVMPELHAPMKHDAMAHGISDEHKGKSVSVVLFYTHLNKKAFHPVSESGLSMFINQVRDYYKKYGIDKDILLCKSGDEAVLHLSLATGRARGVRWYDDDVLWDKLQKTAKSVK